MVPFALAGQSPLDGFNPNANDAVRALAAQSDGKILAGGDFISIAGATANRITRLIIDGTSDTTFVCPGTNDSVLAIAVQDNDKILIGGKFTQVGGTARTYIARLNRNGSLDTSFNAALNGAVTSIAVQNDGKVVCAGQFTSTNSTTHNRVTRLNTDGSPDTSFSPGAGADNTVNALALQKDGKIIIGGAFTHAAGSSRIRIARLNANGSLDGSFNPNMGPNGVVNSVAIQADGKILIGGAFTSPGNRIIRLNTDGALDAAFVPGPGADGEVLSIAAQPDGKIVAGGAFTTMNGSTCSRIARLKLDGSLDPDFACAGTSDTVHAVMVQSDGKITFGGVFTQAQGIERNRLARLYPNGALDVGFESDISTLVTLAIRPDWRILVSGPFGYLLNINGLTNPNSLKVALGAEGMAIRRDGNTVLGAGSGWNTLTADGRIIYSFPYPTKMIDLPDDYEHYMALCHDDALIVNRTSTDGWNPGVAWCIKFTPAGRLDSTFLGSSYAGFGPIALQPDQKVLLTQTGQGQVLRLMADGTFDPTFAMAPQDWISWEWTRSIALQSDGKILIGGKFASLGGLIRNAIIRVNSNGTVDTAFDSPVYPSKKAASVLGMVLQSNGKILALANRADAASTVSFPRLVRLNADGSPDPTFDPIWSHATETRDMIALQADGKILFGGGFDFIEGGKRYRRLVRLVNSEAALQKLSVSPTGRTVYWKLGGSYPWPYQVLFEESIDGETWSKLGHGVPVPGFGYQLDGVHILRGHYIRATGYVACGRQGGSVSLHESVLWVGDPSVPYAASGQWTDYN